MTWVVFGLLAASCWASVQLVDKLLIHFEAPSWLHYLAISGIAVIPIVVLGAPFALPDPQGHVVLWGAAAGVLSFLVNGFLFYALVTLDADVTAAALAVVPSLSAVVVWIGLHQHLSIRSGATCGLPRPVPVMDISIPLPIGDALAAQDGGSFDRRPLTIFS